MTEYESFIAHKGQASTDEGIAPLWMPDTLFDFQQCLVEWALRKGRAAVFATTGMGKSAMQLVWSENVVRKTNRPVLIVAPLAVSSQTIREGAKFGIEVRRAVKGEPLTPGVWVTNYERLHHFEASAFAGAACDESSCIKGMDGATRALVTDFLRKMDFRSLWTATPSPNDYVELGTSSEALGYLGHMDMLSRFFKNNRNNSASNPFGRGDTRQVQWRFAGHAEQPFWRWVCSWARTVRRPSDLDASFNDARFTLPPLIEREHIVEARTNRDGLLFSMPAVGLSEEREERRRTLVERCERAAALVVDTGQPAVCWAHLNDEADLLERLVPDAIQVSGRDADEEKEEKFDAFASGQARVLVTKHVIGAWGLNWQHCAHTTMFASHSFEQTFQSIRRFWRFGQEREVTVDTVISDGEQRVLANLRRKSDQADRMFDGIVKHMRDELAISRNIRQFFKKEGVPTWL